MQKYVKISLCSWIIGCLLVIIGVIVILIFPSLFHKAVKKDMVLTVNSKSYDYWKTIQLPIYQKFYFFNVTNSDKIEKNGATPILEEVGPYVYREQLIKENITWNDNGTVTYQERHIYTFQQNMTDLHEDDVIMTINAPFITLAKTLDAQSIFVKFLADLALVTILKKESLFVKHTVKELTFGGYHDILVALSSLILKNPPIYGNKFGWFYPKNNSNDGIYTVETGKNNFSKFLCVDKWQNQSSLNYWSGDYCNAIKGPMPELFKPLNNEDKLDMFVTDLCRSVQLEYKDDVTVHNVIKSRYYVMPNSTLASSEENNCFCNGECFPFGVMNISACHGGAPIALSWPHFYMGDPQLVQDVIGLKPNKKKHEFYWDVEPITGMTSQFSARIQINVPLKKHPYIARMTKVPNVLFPVLWISKDGVMTDYLANNLLEVIKKPQEIADITSYCVIAVGLLIIVCTTIIFFVIRIKNGKMEHKDSLDSLLVNEEYADS